MADASSFPYDLVAAVVAQTLGFVMWVCIAQQHERMPHSLCIGIALCSLHVAVSMATLSMIWGQAEADLPSRPPSQIPLLRYVQSRWLAEHDMCLTPAALMGDKDALVRWDRACGWGSELLRLYLRNLLGSASMLMASIIVWHHMPHMLVGCLGSWVHIHNVH